MTNQIFSKEQLASILMKNGFEKYPDDNYYAYSNKELDISINKNGVLCIYDKTNHNLRETGVQEIVFDIFEITGKKLIFKY